MENICYKIAYRFYEKKMIVEEDVNALRFAFELIITQFITYFTMLIIGIFVNKVVETIVFGLTFGILRRKIQGYHAKTFKMCYILTTLNYLLVIYMLELNIPYFILNIVIIIFICFYFENEEKIMIYKMTLLYGLILSVFYFFNQVYFINLCTITYATTLLMRLIGGNDNENCDS